MTAVEPRFCPQARTSTEADIKVIRAWLERQEHEEDSSTFLCNWNLTHSEHTAGQLLVYVDDGTGEAVAYQWGRLLRSGILEVRRDMRGLGIGQALVAHRMAEAFAAGEDILHIQCKPSSSIPFWRKMGFEVRRAADGMDIALRYMSRKLELPLAGEPVQLCVEWFPEDRKWEPSRKAVRTLPVEGVRTGSDEVQLDQRAHCSEDEVEHDLVLRVSVDGNEWYCDKAKYAANEKRGVHRCRNGFYLDSFQRT